jgi:hypothetical protein
MNQHPDEAAPVIKSIWQRPDWRLIKGARSPEEPTEENERAVQAYFHEVEQMVSALEEAKPSGRAVLLRCVSPRDRFRRFWIALGRSFSGTMGWIMQLPGKLLFRRAVGTIPPFWGMSGTQANRCGSLDKIWSMR